MPSPLIFGIEGTRLTAEERAFLTESQPWGIILFARNVENAKQLIALTDSIKNLFNDEYYPILIDQEGGRVARLQPPLMQKHPPAAFYGKLYQQDPDVAQEATRLGAHFMAQTLTTFGININCAPCLDLYFPTASKVIGDRAFSADPAIVATLARAFMEGLRAGGVTPVIKHLPGHGRATDDSHHALPNITASEVELVATDFVPFHALAPLYGEGGLAMTGHLCFPAIDEEISTFSASLIERIVRQHFGFKGLLMSDDISMSALSGDYSTRAERAFAAGCDIVLHCNANMAEMQAITKASLPTLNPTRLTAVRTLLRKPAQPLSEEAQKRWQFLTSADKMKE